MANITLKPKNVTAEMIPIFRLVRKDDQYETGSKESISETDPVGSGDEASSIAGESRVCSETGGR